MKGRQKRPAGRTVPATYRQNAGPRPTLQQEVRLRVLPDTGIGDSQIQEMRGDRESRTIFRVRARYLPCRRMPARESSCMGG